MWPFVTISLSIMFSRFLHVVAYISALFLFYGWIIFHRMDILHLVYPLSVNGYLSFPHLVGFMNNAIVNVHMNICVDVCFYSLGYIFKSGILASMFNFFEELPNCISKVSTKFYFASYFSLKYLGFRNFKISIKLPLVSY